ncbi:MAG TPA: glutamine amidotransferase family protein [Firmicutes bacterium]|nr:glutamine amidotransferase family protein [Bacillota bacterium]
MLEGWVRIPSGCAIAGIINQNGQAFSGEMIARAMTVMHDRSNGLGGGFAGYGIYPEMKEAYAFHVLAQDKTGISQVDELFKENFTVILKEPLPTRRTAGVAGTPFLMRYFLQPQKENADADQLVAATTLQINKHIGGTFVLSGAKNMGVFKGVGYPEDIAAFFRLDEYKGYLWTGHGRFPTNTPGWWGGAHPFSLLDVTLVHNGEISSYGANRRYLESQGYHMTLQTDSEAIAYACDFLHRRHQLPWEIIAKVFAPPHWWEIDRMPAEERELAVALRRTYGSLLMNGPFSIIVGFAGGMMALNDRLKLRSLVAAQNEEWVFVASEEAAIRAVCPEPESVWYPKGGEAVIQLVKENVECHAA